MLFGELGFALRAEASFLACASAAARFSATAASTAGSRAAGSDMLPPRDLPPGPEPAEEELAVAVDPLLLLAVARAEAPSGAGPRRGAAALPAARPALPRAGSRCDAPLAPLSTPSSPSPPAL